MPPRRSRPPKGPVAGGSATIGFRFDDESHRVLSERAVRLGMSPHELARQYVLEVLQESEERAALREALLALRSNLQQFREDMLFGVEALMVSAGKATESEARAWAERNFKTE
jgi:hypothetical protein